MKIDLTKIGLGGNTLISLCVLFGISWGTITGKLHAILKADQTQAKADSLEIRVKKLEKELELNNHFKELVWEFGKDMTDNNDVERWFVGSHGVEYPVDVRNNNEGKEFAFVDFMYMIYTLRYDRDSIRHLLLHVPNEHKKNRVDLYKSD